MTVHVSGRLISALLLLSFGLWGYPGDTLAQSVVAPQMTAPTLAERLVRLVAGRDRNRIHCTCGARVRPIVRSEEVIVDEGRTQWEDPVGKDLAEFKLKVRSKDPNGRTTFHIEVVEVGVKLAPDTFTLQLSTESRWGK